MDGKDGLILWTLGGAGVLLLYSAYANKSPRTVLASTLGTAPAADAPSSSAAGTGAPAVNPALHERVESGTAYLYDADGNMAGVVPAPYQGSAATYIPPGGMSFA